MSDYLPFNPVKFREKLEALGIPICTCYPDVADPFCPTCRKDPDAHLEP